MSCCHTKKLIMRTRLASDSLSHSADSFSLSLNLCRKQSISLSPSRSVCHSISVAISLSRSVYHSIFVVTSLSHSVCHDSHNQLITSQSVTSQSAVSVTQAATQSVSQSVNHQHAPVYPISTSLSRLDYCTQSVGHSLSIYLSN